MRLHDPTGSIALHFLVTKQVEIKADKLPPSLSTGDKGKYFQEQVVVVVVFFFLIKSDSEMSSYLEGF